MWKFLIPWACFFVRTAFGHGIRLIINRKSNLKPTIPVGAAFVLGWKRLAFGWKPTNTITILAVQTTVL
jgi:hypothetical protein